MTEPTTEQIRRAIARAKGWKVVFRRDFDVALPPEHEIDTFEVIDGWKVKDLRWAIGARWVEDIAAAWELIEEMPAGKTSLHKILFVDDNRVEWECDFGSERWEETIAETAPRAICLAWMKWKGIEVSE